MAKKLKRSSKIVAPKSNVEAQYRLRTSFMYRRQKALAGIIESLHSINSTKLDWHNPIDIGISQSAFDYVTGQGIPLAYVFCHPKVIESNPSLVLYYRSLAVLPQKGSTRLLFDIAQFERGKTIPMGKAVDLAKLLNSYISDIVDSDPRFSINNAQLTVAMSYGAQMNGSWRNAVGEEGVTRVKQILIGFLRERKVVDSMVYKDETILPADKAVNVEYVRTIRLVNGYTLVFGSEPDISLQDTLESLTAVVEVKAGIDPAGALERYGAAKKSFGRAKRRNKNVQTIYIGLLTPGVQKLMAEDELVTKEYEVGNILANRPERQEFLKRILWLSHLEVT